MKTKDFIEMLREHKNPKKSEAMEKYMRNQFTFIGLQAVERRKLSNSYLKQLVADTKQTYKDGDNHKSVIEWESLFYLWQQPEREFQLTGIDYLKRVQEYLIFEDLEDLKQLVLNKSWWDTVDFLSKNIGAIVLKEPLLIDTMKSWSLNSNIWLRRVSILHQLGVKEGTNRVLLKEVILNNIHEQEFFIRKAIGWALREYAKTNEHWVVHFVSNYKEELSTLSYREAVKNIH